MGVEETISAIRLRRILQRSAIYDEPNMNVENDKDTNGNSDTNLNTLPRGEYDEGFRGSSINYWLIVSISLNVLFVSTLLICCSSPTIHLFADSRDVNYDEISATNGLIGRSTNVNDDNLDDGNHHNEKNSYDDIRTRLGLGMRLATQPCSGRGTYEHDDDDNEDGGMGRFQCRCHPCFSGHDCSKIISDCTINFDHGDPKMFEPYWWNNQDLATTVLRGGDRMSYFSNAKGICWFLEPALAMEIKLIHKLVGNAITDGHEIIVGTGSSQIIHAALYALSSSSSKPVDVVSMAPFYSSYPSMTDYLQSGLHQWAGDAQTYNLMSSNKSYVEFVTSPGNPDGMAHTPMVNMEGRQGSVIYDLAYYWPQYTPISDAANHDIMLFTFSKSTGYAGTRIGWALVRDAEIAKKMTKYIELNTIGVSKDSQLRASQVLKAIRRTYSARDGHGVGIRSEAGLFDFGYIEMESRWARLQAAINGSQRFSVSRPPPAHCNFFQRETIFNPAFAWLKCKCDADCHAAFKGNGILTRSGVHFGSGREYVRISMVDHAEVFQLFVTRLQKMSLSSSCGLS